jgi:hypothetical protein
MRLCLLRGLLVAGRPPGGPEEVDR